MSNPVRAIAIVPLGAGFSVSIPGEAITIKDKALGIAKAITTVDTVEQNQAAIKSASELKGLVQGVDAVHKEVKAPYWAACKALDEKRADYKKDIETEITRLERLSGEYQRREIQKAEAARLEAELARAEAERKANEERERAEAAERARIAAEKAAEEAEARRIQAEIDLAEANSKAAKRKAEAELERQKAEAAEAERQKAEAEAAAIQAELDAQQALNERQNANATVFVPEPPKPKGQSLREKVTFEVIDIEAFYAWDKERRANAKAAGRNLPTFVRMEVNARDFNGFLSLCSDDELDEIPGILCSRTYKAQTRATPANI